MHAPTTLHYDAAIKVLRYIKNAPTQGLFYRAYSTLQLKAFSNSDWATCPYARRFVTDYSIFLGHSLIFWKSKKQPTVSRCCTEAEYRALAFTACELQCEDYLLTDFQIPFIKPSLLYCDSHSARHIAVKSSFHERTKHIELDCHLAREILQSKLFQLLPVSSANQLVDVLTKTLDFTPCSTLVSKVGVNDIYPPAWGGIRQVYLVILVSQLVIVLLDFILLGSDSVMS